MRRPNATFDPYNPQYHPLPLSRGLRLGSYEIVSPIGAGGMGEVYLARDLRLDRNVALKILPEALAADAERTARFQREAKTLASLSLRRTNLAWIADALAVFGG